ncbi:MAG: Carbamoyl-phosphate synthase chain ATP-binding protein, partial [Frankiales bacterium]|nr:Carbamoyl-phosphate synthase chain ATP-binding protein [Frankiales bacterium]
MLDDGVLVANRGEVAVRVLRAAADLGLRTVAVWSEDDATCLHTRRADVGRPLSGRGARAYLDAEQILLAAKETGVSAVHPGWGFLAESAAFAERCEQEGLTFVGPSSRVLAAFGDKLRARELASSLGLRVSAGTSDRAQMPELLASTGALMLKAVAGGGGRGMRVVTSAGELADAAARCASEALAAFGNGDLYAEELLRGYRHVEVQVLGDGSGAVTALGERDCSLQRRQQKLVEIAPAPGLPDAVRAELAAAAVTLTSSVGYRGLGTVEFLVGPAGEVVFLEVNPRLQVEHTVTEQVYGVDLVAAQLRLAAGASLAELALPAVPRGVAVQVRVNTEQMRADGTTVPSSGTLTAFDPPAGPGVRTDTHGYTGYETSTAFDSLLAKVVVHGPDLPAALVRAGRALGEFRIAGVPVNVAFLQALLRRPEVGAASTSFVDEHLPELVAAQDDGPQRWFEPVAGTAAHVVDEPVLTGEVVRAPMQGTVVQVLRTSGEVLVGTPVLVLEAMKMEHVVTSPVAGLLSQVTAQVGQTVRDAQPLFAVHESDVDAGAEEAAVEVDLDAIRPDLAEVLHRQWILTDEARPAAVARRRKVHHRTARENLADLVAPGDFVEYGGLATAAQRARRSLEDLIENTQADGIVGGVGHVNADLFDDEHSRAVVLSYDYTVLAGTQGMRGHQKKDRLFELAERLRLPVVLFAEGGGGRPGDTDNPHVAGLDCKAFALFARLSGLVPTVGLVSGRCFAGNAALLGCCDVIIATPDATIGMAGPAMIEGGGLGSYRPEDIGPVPVQMANGVIDVLVEDDAAAVQAAKNYLAYFQGPLGQWEAPDQRVLRTLIPENRLRTYDIRAVVHGLADVGSVMELRPGFAAGMVTALIRIEGRPMGLVANNPSHLGGAIDSDGADKAARFMQLCDAHDLPLLFLCDTPGFMVGPEAEKTAQVRHFGRMFVTGASLSVPFVTVVLRKGYGLGAQAMAGGGFHEPSLIVSWPTGEFGGMGLEGAVNLGFSKELAALEDPAQKKALFDQLLAAMYERGKAVNMASVFEIDDVIDPVETRSRVVGVLRVAPPVERRAGR